MVSEFTPARNRTIRIVAMALIAAEGIWAILVHAMSPNYAHQHVVSVTPPFQQPLYVVAAAELCLAVYWTLQRMKEDLSPAEFQTNMIIAMAIAQAVTVEGLFLFFVTGHEAVFWPFLGAALAVQLGLILPRVFQRTNDS